MQTFLPYADFFASSACLDSQRLGKQRAECKQILLALRFGGSWSNHPAVRMWRGYEVGLAAYGKTVCDEWVARGNDDSTNAFFYQYGSLEIGDYTLPWWFGNDGFHSTHRAALLYKDPTYYGQFGWKETPTKDYWWPVS